MIWGGSAYNLTFRQRGGEGASKIYVPFLCGPPEKHP